jgi:rare lipoprotein A
MSGAIHFKAALCAIALLCFSIAAHAGEQSASSAASASQTGVASWYGGEWIGRRTANGERYGAGDLTAAHRTLRFGTFVRVTNLRNNRNVIVRINNRGPFCKGRILDLSKRAAVELNMLGTGTARVRLEVLSGAELAHARLAMAPGSDS